eukprot:7019286-Karenia_brevis.AAC.1
MLRQVLGVRRRIYEDSNGVCQSESWVDWLQRSAEECKKAMDAYNVVNWAEEAYKRKFRWAGHVARRADGRWTRKVLQWCP